MHPNALGEYQIARVFSHALHKRFGFGGRPLSVPKRIPARPCATPVNLRAVQAETATNVTWDSVYGAFGYGLQTRWEGTDWPNVSFSTLTSNYETAWTVDGHKWEFRVRADCGEGEEQQSKWSDLVVEQGSTR